MTFILGYKFRRKIIIRRRLRASVVSLYLFVSETHNITQVGLFKNKSQSESIIASPF